MWADLLAVLCVRCYVAKNGGFKREGTDPQLGKSKSQETLSSIPEFSRTMGEGSVTREQDLGPSPSFTQMLQKQFQVYCALNLRVQVY